MVTTRRRFITPEDLALFRFPEECHDLSRTGRPDRRLARLKFILRWWETKL